MQTIIQVKGAKFSCSYMVKTKANLNELIKFLRQYDDQLVKYQFGCLFYDEILLSEVIATIEKVKEYAKS